MLWKFYLSQATDIFSENFDLFLMFHWNIVPIIYNLNVLQIIIDTERSTSHVLPLQSKFSRRFAWTVQTLPWSRQQNLQW